MANLCAQVISLLPLPCLFQKASYLLHNIPTRGVVICKFFIALEYEKHRRINPTEIRCFPICGKALRLD